MTTGDKVKILSPGLVKFNLTGQIMDDYGDGDCLVAFQFRFTEQAWVFNKGELEVVDG